jgi:hypothetical protein
LRFSRIVSVLESICVTLRGARGHSAVHQHYQPSSASSVTR